LAQRTDAALWAAVTNGVAATPMPQFGRTLSEDDRWKAVAFLRLLSLGGPGTPSTSSANGGGQRESVPTTPVEPTDAALGNSRKEILRILKRYIARELFPIILESLATTDCRAAAA